LKLAYGAYDEGGEQRGAVGAVEAVEGASEAIVAEEGGLPWLEAEVLGDAADGPLGESVRGRRASRRLVTRTQRVTEVGMYSGRRLAGGR